MAYDDQTVDELQDELRKRDLAVSGSKDDLIERLQADDTASKGPVLGPGAKAE